MLGQKISPDLWKNVPNSEIRPIVFRFNVLTWAKNQTCGRSKIVSENFAFKNNDIGNEACGRCWMKRSICPMNVFAENNFRVRASLVAEHSGQH